MVSIVIVNYNAGDLLRKCVDSISSSVTEPYEIVIVDNDSRDESLNGFDRSCVRILRQDSNLGYARACNIGVCAAKGEVLHLLNPDTEVNDSINESYRIAASSPERCIYPTRLSDPRGVETKAYHAFPLFINIIYFVFNPRRVSRYYIGASLVLNRGVFDELGGLCEDFFVDGDDSDLFYRANLAGIKTVQTNSLVMHHSGAIKSRFFSERQRLLRGEEAALKFTRKYGVRFSYFLFKHLIFIPKLIREPGEAILSILSYWEVRTALLFKS
jgi:GT2 family glycosyltransferase